MAYAPPDPKKVKALRERREAEDKQARQVESCYRQHRTGQQRFAAWRENAPEEAIRASLAATLGIDVSVRLVP